ncbi:phage minor head protein [uncultured Tateyamaria sp.]|uniref:phage head morphogenesis protein n=1 Tax=uncultured Tateyamaria sp. TaxID=455651 RepID=UPI0026272F73|nr:phage minor head protein [uncultured Tateyamaria sp.]
MAEIDGIFKRPFNAQIAAFRLRMGTQVPTSSWRDVWKAQHDRAFMVAGATKADVLADLAKAVEKAIAEGTTLEEFRRDFREIVEKRGWHGWTGEETEAGRAWRTRVIYRTNMRTSYMAGRYAQLMAGPFPIWIYKHSGAAEPRLHHLEMDGLMLPREHAFWRTFFPPNGWGCYCDVVGAASPELAELLGGNPSVRLPPDWDKIDPATGEPHGIGRGWGYAPGATAVDDIQRISGLKQATLPDGLAQAVARWAADLVEGRGPEVPKAP